MGTRIDDCSPLADVLRLIASWRIYRRMQGSIYERLCADLALVIRSRLS